MQKKIAVFGGSFNPPGLHHRQMIYPLLKAFDEIIIVPCGDRPDKPATGSVAPMHRAAMAHLAFDDVSPKVRVDDFDLQGGTFTRMVDLQAKYAPRGEIWHVVGGDLVVGGANGRSDIQTQWRNGPQLWQTLNFAVFPRGPEALPLDDFPPHNMVFRVTTDGASKIIRQRLVDGLPIDGLVAPKIAAYIRVRGLYRQAA